MPYTPASSRSCILSPGTAASVSRPNQPGATGSSSYTFKHRQSPTRDDAERVLFASKTATENLDLDPHGWPFPLTTRFIIPVPKERDPDVEKLKELQEGISLIEARGTSPDPIQDDGSIQVDVTAKAQLPLSEAARKISHSRSPTDSTDLFDAFAAHVVALAEFEQAPDKNDGSDGNSTSHLSMVRKKSGELVRPALRQMSKRRPSSTPGTPTCSKTVHFDSHLEYVRHFLHVDRPLAVSAGSSPVEQFEAENDFPLGLTESTTRSLAPLAKWEIRLPNFPDRDIQSRKSLPVYGEKICLSSDSMTLIGSIVVHNLAFQKTVVFRFTFDYWGTTSEVIADYDYNIHQKQQNDGLDRFQFSVNLADQVRLEEKTLFFCIRYSVNGKDYWDSNNGCNYQVDFFKKLIPQQGKTADFATDIPSMSFGESAWLIIDESKVKLRTSPPTAKNLQAAPQRRSHQGSRNFRDRYDLNSSLTAAKNSACALLDD